MDAKTKSANQIRLELHQQGKTISSWAKEHGYSRTDVSRVINGLAKGQRAPTACSRSPSGRRGATSSSPEMN